MNHRSSLSVALTLSLGLSLMIAPACLNLSDAEAKPGAPSPLKAKTSPKTTKKGESKPLQKKPAKTVPARPAPAKPAPTKAAPPAKKTLGAAKSPSRTTSAGKATGFQSAGVKGAPSAPARASKGGELAAPETLTKPSVGSFEAPVQPGPKAPSTTVVRPVDAPSTPASSGSTSSPRPTRRVLGAGGDEPQGKGIQSGGSTTTTTTTTTTSNKRSKSFKKGKRTSRGVQQREETYQESGYGGGGGGGYGAPAPSYGGAPSRGRSISCRPEGNKVMVNVGVGFESTQEMTAANMAYVLGGGLRSGFLGVVGEVQMNQKDGESETTAWGGQVRLYLPLGSCLDVYPLAGISQQKAGLDQFKGTTNAYDLGVGADFNIFGALALGARYTRSFFSDELKAVNIQSTTNSRDTFVVQLSLFF